MDGEQHSPFCIWTAALNVPAKYDVLRIHGESDSINLESGGRSSGRLLRICDEQKNAFWRQPRIRRGDGLWTGQARIPGHRVIEQDGAYYIRTDTAVNALDRVLYLETMKDV